MNQANDIVFVHHMLDAALEAREFMGNSGFEDFFRNRMLANAVVRSLEIIGEAASKTSEEFRKRYPAVEWRVIIGMRNRLIHAYFDVDYAVVWKTVRENLPPFINELKNILEEFKDSKADRQTNLR